MRKLKNYLTKEEKAMIGLQKISEKGLCRYVLGVYAGEAPFKTRYPRFKENWRTWSTTPNIARDNILWGKSNRDG